MRIELPAPRIKIHLCFSVLFLLVAATFAIQLFYHPGSRAVGDLRGRIFDTALFALWSLSYFVMYRSRYAVEVSCDEFKVVRRVLWFKLNRSYRMADISHLRFTPYPNDRRRGVLSFDRKGRTRWLPMLEPENDSDKLLARAYAKFPNLSVRQKALNIR